MPKVTEWAIAKFWWTTDPNYRKTLILSIFTFQIPNVDPQGNEIPKWKREMMAKKAAEKAKGNDHDKFIYLSENISSKLNFYLLVFHNYI